MDFSACTNLIEDQNDHIIIPRIRAAYKTPTKPTKASKSTESPKNITVPTYNTNKTTKNEEFLGLRISFVKPNEKKIKLETSSSTVYDHVYKNDKNFEQTLQFHKNFKFADSPTRNGRFVDDLKLSKIKKMDFRRLKWEKTNLRSQTAANNKDFVDFDVKIRKNKDKKSIKRELIPQTKANLCVKSENPPFSLRIKGVIKDFAIRKHFKLTQ